MTNAKRRIPGARWFLVLVVLQALFLLGLAATTHAAVWFGKEIRLQTVPIDPRDLLYGDYVILSYEISRLSPDLWQGGELPQDGDTVYVALAPKDGEVYGAVAAYPRREEVPQEQVLLKGIVDYSWEREIFVRYGLERYYVPEGTGQALEEQAGNLTVVVRVAPWGQATLTDVLEKK